MRQAPTATPIAGLPTHTPESTSATAFLIAPSPVLSSTSASINTLTRESHFVWGGRYLLKVIEEKTVPFVELRHSQMILTVRPGAVMAKREAVYGMVSRLGSKHRDATD